MEPLSGVHHGRLAFEQTYSYMVYDEIIYGIISTFNSFIFLKRESPGILYMSRMIPINSTTPTIMKLLYFFSHLCARDPIPCPETNLEGIVISLRKSGQNICSSENPKSQYQSTPPSKCSKYRSRPYYNYKSSSVTASYHL